MNKIWNIKYKVWLKTYKYSLGWDVYWREIYIVKYELIRKTKKMFIIKGEIYRTFLYDKHKLQIQNSWEQRYKKENVKIMWIETNEDVLKKLNKTIKLIKESKNYLTENEKKEYEKSYNILYKYFNN